MNKQFIMRTWSDIYKPLAASLLSGAGFAGLCMSAYLTQGEWYVSRSFESGLRVGLAGGVVGLLTGLGTALGLVRPAYLAAGFAALASVAMVPLYMCDGGVLVIPLVSSVVAFVGVKFIGWLYRKGKRPMKTR